MILWILSQNKKLLTNGQLIFYIEEYVDENNKKEFHVMLKEVSVAKYSSKKMCQFVLVKLVDYLNQNENKAFKFPTEEQVMEMIKNDKN